MFTLADSGSLASTVLRSSIVDSRISPEKIRQAASVIDPVFLHSPQFESESLNDALGTRVLIKVETLNPIRSFKGRGAEYLVATRSDDRSLICASAGNFGQAIAFACRKRGLPLKVYAATTANPYKVERMRALGADVTLFGEDFDASKAEAKRVAKENGYAMVEDGLAVETIEGAGTIGLELVEAVELDGLLIALGNGALFNGVATVFNHLRPKTKRIAVQAAGASAMADSWRAGKLIAYPTMNTIADGIGVRLPIPEALADMKSLADDVITVREDSIVEGMKLIHTHVGIVAEPSAAVGIAAILENRNRFSGLRLATIICGSNLTDEQRRKWLM